MSQTRGKPIDPLAGVFRSTRTVFVFAALFSGIINVLMLTGSVFMMQVYDRVMTSRSVPTLVALAMVTVVLYAFSGLMELVRARLMIRVGRFVDATLRQSTFDCVVEHSVRKAAGVGTQPLRDLDAVRGFLSGPGPFAIFDIPWVPLYVGLAAILHPWLGVLTLAAAVALLLLALLTEWSARSGSAAVASASIRSHILAEEANGSAEVIKAMGMQKTFGARWSAQMDSLVEHQTRAADRASVFSSISKVFRYILQSAALALGAYLAINGEITAGVIIGGSIIMSRALAPIDQAIGHWRQFVNYRQSKRRLGTAMGAAPPSDSRMTLPRPKGALSAEGLIVLAPNTTTPLVQGVTFALPPGSGLGVVGATGAGKSTLARALVGAWPIGKGSVRLDGAKLDQWPPEQLGRSIGYLPQEISLLSGTVQDNISRFDPRPDPEAVVEAARRANVHDMILRLPEGYNTRLGADGGVALSGGQRQRIALARALYGNPAVLVLDEPNSNLDGDGEGALASALQDARASGTTVILIAHRPSALRSVDHLLFLKDGRQAAFGPKDEVLAKIQSDRGPRAAPGLAVVTR